MRKIECTQYKRQIALLAQFRILLTQEVLGILFLSNLPLLIGVDVTEMLVLTNAHHPPFLEGETVCCKFLTLPLSSFQKEHFQ